MDSYKYVLINKKSDSSFFSYELYYSILCDSNEIGTASSKVYYDRTMLFEIEITDIEHFDKIKENLIYYLILELNEYYKLASIKIEFDQLDVLRYSINELHSVLSRIGFDFYIIDSENEVTFHFNKKEELQVGECWPKYVTDNGEWGIFVISKNYYGDKFDFNISQCNIPLKPGTLIAFKFSDIGIPGNFSQFFSETQGHLLDLDRIRKEKRIDLHANLRNADFILNMDLYKSDSELNVYSKICRNLNYLEKSNESKEELANYFFNKYNIDLGMTGKTKHGDYKMAWISIMTSRATTSFYFDGYLNNLAPNFEYDFGHEYDQCYTENYSDIHERISAHYGGMEQINEIKKNASELSNMIKKFAMSIYSREDHIDFLKNEKRKLREKILSRNLKI